MIGRNRGAFALVGVLVIAVIAAVVALAGSLQVTTSRRSLERIQVRRLVEMCAVSAVEEACADLEAKNSSVPSPDDGQGDLGSKVAWPSDFDPKETRSGFAGGAVAVGSVRVVSNTWDNQRKNLPNNQYMVRQVGVLEFRVKMSVKSGGAVLAKEVRVRRYATAIPTQDDLSAVGLRIQGNNLMLTVADA